MRHLLFKYKLLSYQSLLLLSLFQDGCRQVSNLSLQKAQVSKTVDLRSHPIIIDPTDQDLSPSQEQSIDSKNTVNPRQSAEPNEIPQLTFESGINVAWVDFAHDVGTGNPKLAEIEKQLAQVSAAGGKVARLWLHTDGSLTPEFHGNRVVGPGPQMISDLKKILDLAAEQNMKLMLTLWSFDMLRAEMKKDHPERIPRNRLLLTNNSYLQDYLNKGLSPLVQAFHSHPALHSWDICNEPEGMTTAENWGLVDAKDRIDLTTLQTFINKTAGHIHRLAPQNKVTVGAVSFKYLASKGPYGNIYSDRALIAQGKDPLGTLDIYQGHHYAKIGTEWSPFQNSAKDFGLDKPTIVGEFDMKEYMEYGASSPRKLYAQLKNQGFSGALGWKDGAIPALQVMLSAMNELNFQAPSEDKPNLCSHFQGGYGKPFFSGTKLYRNRINKDSPTAEGWCEVN